MTRKQVNAALEAANVHPDKVSMKKDGTVEVSHSYFYRHGRSAESWAATVARAFPNATVTGEDRWAAWPRQSYFVAVVRMAAEG